MQFGEIGVARAWFQHNEKGPQEGVVVGRVYRYHTQRVFGGRTELTDVSGTGINFVPNLTGAFRKN